MAIRDDLARAFALCALLAAGAAEAAGRVVMVSIDGLRPELYGAPEAAGIALPNLVALRDAGVSADRMIPVFPSLTYPAHATMATGVNPARHGVVSNYRHGFTWYRDAAEVKVDSLWDRARAAGKTTALLMWPLSHGAGADWLIPEDANLEGAAFAASLAGSSTPGLIAELAPACGTPAFPAATDLDAVAAIDRYTTCASVEILRRHRPELLMLHLVNVDHIEHLFGPHHKRALAALETVDAQIGALRTAVAAAGLAEETAFVIVGDHGFVPVHTLLNLNALLRDAGYARDEGGKLIADADITISTAGGSAAIYLGGRRNTERGARALAQALRKAIDARYAGLLEVFDTEELARREAFPGAAVALAAQAGYLLLGATDPGRMLPTGMFKGMHGYAPEMPAMATGFIAAGASVRGAFRLPVVRQLDVAPTVAKLLGIELPAATGMPVTGIFEYSTRANGADYGVGPQN